MSVSFGGKYRQMIDDDYENDALHMNLSNDNFIAFARLLELPTSPEGLIGQLSVSDARRKIVKARATFGSKVGGCERVEEVQHGKPRVREDGAVELRPLRAINFGCDVERLRGYLDRFEALVLALESKGATHVVWY